MNDSSPSDAATAARLVPLLGTLDIYGASAARETLLALRSEPHVELDLSAVPSCDVAGLQVLLSARSDAEKGGRRLVISRPSAAVSAACTALGLAPASLFNT